MEKIPMTAAGFKGLEEELNQLKNVDRHAIIAAIAEARAHGDLSENAEYHAAKEKQSFIEGRVMELEDQIGRADVIDISKLSGSSVKFGATVTLVDEDTDEERKFQIVGDVESDAKKGRISLSSPIARALIGKSKGDTVEGLLNDYGVDVLRWWVSSLSYENDIKVDREFFDAAGESYRKVRNTLRFMLSNLSDYTHDAAVVSSISSKSLDAWVISEFEKAAKEARRGFEAYDFRSAHAALFDFCNQTLSAVYLAAVKDRLYCDRKDSPRRRRTQAALWLITDGLCRLLAPVVPHTADEAYRSLWKSAAEDARCVHLETFPGESGVTADPCWKEALEAREIGLLALERVRSQGGVENPLDAGVTLPDPKGLLAHVERSDLADLLGVSRVVLDAGAKEASVSDLRGEPRCERSWKRDGTVRVRADGGTLSDRDAEAVGTT